MVGSQLLDESQIRWSSSGSGTEARDAQNLVKIGDFRQFSGRSSKRLYRRISFSERFSGATSGKKSTMSGKTQIKLLDLVPELPDFQPPGYACM